MKKLIAFAAILLLGFGLTGCSLFGSAATTTTTVATTVDTDNFIDINNVTDLQNIEMNKSYILQTDLDLTGIEWAPIGTNEAPYLGIFDGNGHTISNLTITKANNNFNGLFGYVQGTVKNLDIKDFSIDYSTDFLTYAGGLTGYLIGDATNITTNGTINIDSSSSNVFAGLLAGLSQAVLDSTTTVDNFKPNKIDNNTVSGSIIVNPTNYAYVGGLVGKAYNSEFTNNQATGTINVSGGDSPLYIGGLVGHYYGGILIGFEDQVDSTDINIQNNISNEDITVTKADNGASIGGLVGYTQYGNYTDNAAISNLTIGGDNLNVGGFIGENWHTSLKNLFAYCTANVATTDTTIYKLGTLLGFDYPTTTIDTGYFYFNSGSTTFDTQGTDAMAANFTNSNWYGTTFGWDADFYNKILAIVNS